METVIIVNERPSIYEKLHERFGVEWDDGIIIAYAPFVHCKKNLDDMPEKVVHESVHLEQQGKEPEKWWKHYMLDPHFRLEQEADAYAAEVRWIRKHINDRNRQMRMINRIAHDLSSPMYGNIISQMEALALFINLK